MIAWRAVRKTRTTPATGWRGWLEAGLGDTRTRILGVLLIFLAVLGTIVLRSFANIETVFVAAILAGSILGRWWTVLVPLSALLILQPLEWGFNSGFRPEVMAGISFFVVTGFLFVALIGSRVRPRVLFRVKSVALVTMISVPLTLSYDVWTAFGEWYFLARPFGVELETVLYLQIPFTLYHLLSALIFVPLFGTTFLFLHTFGWPAAHEEANLSEPSDRPRSEERVDLLP